MINAMADWACMLMSMMRRVHACMPMMHAAVVVVPALCWPTRAATCLPCRYLFNVMAAFTGGRAKHLKNAVEDAKLRPVLPPGTE